MDPILTSRLRLVPATAELVRLEVEDTGQLLRRLGASPVTDWPPDELKDVVALFARQLEETPELVGWLSWYWVLRSPVREALVGGGGFKGAPVDGMVEIGYNTRMPFRRRGYATEAVGALTEWALGQPMVRCVRAETSRDNDGSIGVLRKLGYSSVEPGSDPEVLWFERRST
jgi:ribosomal-protein-alanine N-acetyltransferase